jgi:hypothetical protein
MRLIEVIERLNLMRERCCNGYDAEALNLAIKDVDIYDRIKAIIDNWAVDDDEHELLEKIADIIDGTEEENGNT